MARQVAQDLGIPFKLEVMSQAMGTFVGEGARNIKQIFDDAREQARKHPSKKALIFLDELDAIGSRAVNDNGVNRGKTLTITSLLGELDGATQHDDVTLYVVGATNDPDSIDPAIKRAGRLENIIPVLLPNEDEREDTLSFYAKATRYNKEAINFKELARLTDGFTKADLSFAVRQAALEAVRSQEDCIMPHHYHRAFESMRKQKTLSHSKHFLDHGTPSKRDVTINLSKLASNVQQVMRALNTQPATERRTNNAL
jgi:ATP-dependent 26S proteasome regulatory subunit